VPLGPVPPSQDMGHGAGGNIPWLLSFGTPCQPGDPALAKRVGPQGSEVVTKGLQLHTLQN